MFCTYAVAVLVTWMNPVRADDVETLPVPRQEFVAPDMVPAGQYRVSRYAVWQNLAVDRNNQFRPRVVLSPYGGAYYLYDGSPYYFLGTKSYNVSTTQTGTPYRSPPVIGGP